MEQATPPDRTAATPRQPRARRTCADILSATEKLVETEGADAVTTTRIAAITGLAVGTIYRYYPNREALLLAAYDATVDRIIAACTAQLATLEPRIASTVAAARLLDMYLAAAEAIPAHFELLHEMRRLRPVADQGDRRVETAILMPLLELLGLGAAATQPGRLTVLYALLSTLVDLYLMTGDKAARANIRAELEAHARLALSRLEQG